MPPKIRAGYPVPFLYHGTHKVGIAVDSSLVAEGMVRVVYLTSAFKAHLAWLRWQDNTWVWAEPTHDGPSAEDNPLLEPFVITVKNGRYG